MHLKKCEFYADGKCCNEDCINKGKPNCIDIVYKPEKCVGCRESGVACVPPPDHSEEAKKEGFKILTKAEVEAEAKRISSGAGKEEHK